MELKGGNAKKTTFCPSLIQLLAGQRARHGHRQPHSGMVPDRARSKRGLGPAWAGRTRTTNSQAYHRLSAPAVPDLDLVHADLGGPPRPSCYPDLRVFFHPLRDIYGPFSKYINKHIPPFNFGRDQLRIFYQAINCIHLTNEVTYI